MFELERTFCGLTGSFAGQHNSERTLLTKETGNKLSGYVAWMLLATSMIDLER